MTFEQINTNLIDWARDRNILSIDNASKQLIKLGEEKGELCSAYLKQDLKKELDSIGDVLVVLSIYCHQRGIDINECFNLAWNEIKDRTGQTLNGTFVKDEIQQDQVSDETDNAGNRINIFSEPDKTFDNPIILNPTNNGLN